LSKVDKGFLLKAQANSWKYMIARTFHISPVEVATWEADEVLEALAHIALVKAHGGG
jgi:hypothetical protein